MTYRKTYEALKKRFILNPHVASNDFVLCKKGGKESFDTSGLRVKTLVDAAYPSFSQDDKSILYVLKFMKGIDHKVSEKIMLETKSYSLEEAIIRCCGMEAVKEMNIEAKYSSIEKARMGYLWKI